MTNLFKRRWLQVAALTAVSAAVLVGCGKKEEAKPAEAPAAAAKAEPLKIAFAYVGPVGDGGWTFAHDNARKALQAEFEAVPLVEGDLFGGVASGLVYSRH